MPMTLRTRKLPSGFWKGATARRTTRRSKSTRAVKSLAPRARKAVATIAKSVLNRKLETNYAVDNEDFTWEAIYGDTVPSGGSVQIYTCMPQIPQGDASSEHHGVKISPSKHVTDLQFIFGDELLYGPGPGPGARLDSLAWDVTVHVWYGMLKRYKSTDDVNGNKPFIANNLFEINGGIQQRFSGRLEDLMNERNKDFGTLKHKSFRMFKSAGNANNGASTDQYQPCVTQRKLRLTFKAPKVLKYADETSFYPENYAPFILVGYCHNDGSQASNVTNPGVTTNLSQLPALQMLQVNKMWFKDA